MDMVFNSLPDVFSYQALRHTSYENPWTQSKDKPKVQKKYSPTCTDSKTTKDSCPICQERQRRPLATYIRSKSKQDRKEDCSIEEECDIQESNSQQQQQPGEQSLKSCLKKM